MFGRIRRYAKALSGVHGRCEIVGLEDRVEI
jgi:hypothetical protein